MLHSRKNSNKIKHLHDGCLQLIYSDKKLFYENLLEKNNSVSIYHKNIQAFAIEMFKVKRNLCPEITGDIFMGSTNNQFNLCNCSDFITPPYIGSFMEQKVFHILDLRYGILFQKDLNIRNHSTVLKNPSKCRYQLIVLADFAKFT